MTTELITLARRAAPARRLALFDKGFRPLFLLAALFAVAGVPAWLLVRRGHLALGEPLLPSAWHAHEMVFGFAAAVIAGFLLTAASNWTGRVTAVGPALAAICAVWLAGRVAMLVGGTYGAAVALAFLPLVAIAVGRPILLAKSKRNYGIVGLLALLFAAQALTLAGAWMGDVGWQVLGPRLGVDLVIVLVLVIGGRVIPMFTRNATGASDIANVVWLDRLAVGGALALAALDAAQLRGPALAIVAAVTAVAALARAWRWGARRSLAEPLLWVLHVGYLFVPLGLALRAVAVLSPAVDDSTATHALTVGAIGTLILGMMARVSLGHTGRALVAGRALGVAFGLVALAALVRVVGPLAGLGERALDVAATLWTVAFLIYLARVGPALFTPRPDGKPG
ncbi:MAG: NnrS family protein [Sandaracinaceae bacterium]|nr:NnrS family protein [Sandaracinaceae bacterium]